MSDNPNIHWFFSFKDELNRLGVGRWISLHEELPAVSNRCEVFLSGGELNQTQIHYAYYYPGRGWALSQEIDNKGEMLHPIPFSVSHWRYAPIGIVLDIRKL